MELKSNVDEKTGDIHYTFKYVIGYGSSIYDCKVFPKATSATCSQFIAFAMGQEQPVGGALACQVVDPNGDVAIQSGAFQADGTVLITQVAGTGKWAAFVGTQLIGKTDIQVDPKTSTYSWTSAN